MVDLPADEHELEAQMNDPDSGQFVRKEILVCLACDAGDHEVCYGHCCQCGCTEVDQPV